MLKEDFCSTLSHTANILFSESLRYDASMPPRNKDVAAFISEDDSITNHVEPEIQQQVESQTKRPPMKIVWRNVIWILYLHLAALYGVCLLASAKVSTLLWSKFYLAIYLIFIIIC